MQSVLRVSSMYVNIIFLKKKKKNGPTNPLLIFFTWFLEK